MDAHSLIMNIVYHKCNTMSIVNYHKYYVQSLCNPSIYNVHSICYNNIIKREHRAAGNAKA